MAPVNRYTVAFITGDGSTTRQLSDFPTAEKREELVNYLLSLKATTFGDWYKLPTVDNVHAGIQKTEDLKGNCYDLPYRKQGEGFS
jgi:hypothetical protein